MLSLKMEVGGKEGVILRVIPKTYWVKINDDFTDALLAVRGWDGLDGDKGGSTDNSARNRV